MDNTARIKAIHAATQSIEDLCAEIWESAPHAKQRDDLRPLMTAMKDSIGGLEYYADAIGELLNA